MTPRPLDDGARPTKYCAIFSARSPGDPLGSPSICGQSAHTHRRSCGQLPSSESVTATRSRTSLAVNPFNPRNTIANTIARTVYRRRDKVPAGATVNVRPQCTHRNRRTNTTKTVTNSPTTSWNMRSRLPCPTTPSDSPKARAARKQHGQRDGRTSSTGGTPPANSDHCLTPKLEKATTKALALKHEHDPKTAAKLCLRVIFFERPQDARPCMTSIALKERAVPFSDR